jgi:hypothetical protein
MKESTCPGRKLPLRHQRIGDNGLLCYRPWENGLQEFMGGLRLSGLFYEEVVRPTLESEFPGLSYSAARLGSGSEVLGYDTPRSADHEWGPRLDLFLTESDHKALAGEIEESLRWRLPYRFMGYSTHWGEADAEGVRIIEERSSRPVEHRVVVHTVRDFFESWTGLDPYRRWEPADWLVVPQQRLLEMTAGRVYHDGIGELGEARRKLAYYPRDVWMYLMAAQWRRIGQLEAFVGRTGEVGDDLGSSLVAAGLVRDLARLCFLQERRYAPYAKWFGTAFARLRCAPQLGPVFERVLKASSWKEREEHLTVAYEGVEAAHNALDVTPPLEAEVSLFHGRPYLVVHAERFATAIEGNIEDPLVRALPKGVGAADQVTDNTDVLTSPKVYGGLRALYGGLPNRC